jgi:trehalose 6-phosphate synthase
MLRDSTLENATRKPGGTVPGPVNTYIVANRLPVEYHAVAGWRRSPGGLVSAVQPALQDLSAVWVGWRGSPTPEDGSGHKPTRPPPTATISVIEVPLSEWEVRHFYDGACNAAFWPLYHGAIVAPVFRDEEFAVYREINRRFAASVAASAPHGATVWVHDYQLQLVPALLRETRPDLRIGFFLHVPFPVAADFAAMPWKDSVLHGLLGADLIGFQTAASAGNFLEAACLGGTARRDGQRLLLSTGAGTRSVKVATFPVGPDSAHFSSLAATPAAREQAAQIRADFGSPELVLLGIDRLDYTKAIDLRIQAVASLLKSDEFRERDIQFIQVAVPSRSDLAAYRQYRIAVEEALQSANTELASLGLRPIHCVNEGLPVEQVVALYVAADVMLVTSTADGMNLVDWPGQKSPIEGSQRLVDVRI